ncbi:ParB/RepB/Spo0J family partition protein [Limibacillus halophilus]
MARSPKKRGLGRGLAALFDEGAQQATAPQAEAPAKPAAKAKGSAPAEEAAAAGQRLIPIERLEPSPYQPRQHFDKEALDALAASIKQNGLLQPILVRPHASKKNHFEIVAGERRWRAAQKARLHEVPVILREFDNAQTLEIAIVENVQRQDLNPLEEGEGYQRLIDEFGNSQEAIAKVVGKSRSHIANTLRLLGLPKPVKQLITEGKITAGHARALIGAPDPVTLAKQVAARGLSVREVERLAQSVKTGKTAAKIKRAVEKDADTIALEKDLEAELGMKVSISHRGEGGSLTLQYKTLEQLDDLLARLNRPL